MSKISIRTGFVSQRKVPPFFRKRLKAVTHHRLAQDHPVFELYFIDLAASGLGCGGSLRYIFRFQDHRTGQDDFPYRTSRRCRPYPPLCPQLYQTESSRPCCRGCVRTSRQCNLEERAHFLPNHGKNMASYAYLPDFLPGQQNG